MSQQLNHIYHPKFRPDIDGLRAIAVISVIGFHAFPSIIQGGFAGVDIFFVISGFLISSIIYNSLEKDAFSFKEFYIKRIKRIYPSLITLLIGCLIFGWLTLMPDDYKQLGKHIAGAGTFTNNFLLKKESGYFDASADTKPLLHLWSLSIEEQFYIFWPLILWLGYKLRLNQFIVIVVLAIISLSAHFYKLEIDKPSAFYYPQFRAWELLIGAFVAYLKLKPITKLNHNALMTLSNTGLALIVVGIFFLNKDLNYPGWYGLIFPVVGTALVLFNSSSESICKKILSNKILIWLGLISYPLYLWHWPLLSFAHILDNENPSYLIRISAIFLSILLAAATYYWIESPIRLGKTSKLKIKSLIVLLVAVALLGNYIDRHNGLGARFPKALEEISNYKYDQRTGWRERTCFLQIGQEFKAFNDCHGDIDKTKKTILLWGDSHAAQLYPGLKKYYGDNFNIIQRTTVGCAPILNMDNSWMKNCRAINDNIYQEIAGKTPDVIMLAANWSDDNWLKIDDTIQKLKAIGIGRIILIGPVPHWKESVQKQLYAFYKDDPLHRIPQRMSFGLDNDKFVPVDAQMRVLAAKEHINYVSPKSILCNQDGCLTRITESGDTLTTWDYGHLTDIGSFYLASKLPSF